MNENNVVNFPSQKKQKKVRERVAQPKQPNYFDLLSLFYTPVMDVVDYQGNRVTMIYGGPKNDPDGTQRKAIAA